MPVGSFMELRRLSDAHAPELPTAGKVPTSNRRHPLGLHQKINTKDLFRRVRTGWACGDDAAPTRLFTIDG